MTPQPNRQIGACIALSALVHSLLLVGVPSRPIERATDLPPLQATLMANASPAPARVPPPARAAAVPRRQPIARPPAQPIAAGTPESRPSSAAAPAEAAPEAVPVALPASATPTPPAIEAPAVPAAATEAALPPADARPLRRLPREGRIVYELFHGEGRMSVGRTVQDWKVDGDAYTLSSASQTTGLAALFRAYQLVYESRGRITPDGLQPEQFSSRRGSTGEQRSAARLNWEEQTIAFDSSDARVEKLSVGAQDLLSFVFQLSLGELTPGRIQIPVTNGARLEPYWIEIGESETLELPLGKLKAVPVRKVRQRGEEGIEIWLAPEYRNLPVRTRFFDRDGKMTGEQVATEIRVSSD